MKVAFSTLALASVLLLSAKAHAQNYAISWYKVAGGGGTSSGGTYALSGTIGQPDASTRMSGGNYSLTGGFWAFLQVLQTPGAPKLYITVSGTTVTVYWQNVSGWNLQQTSSVNPPVTWTLNSSWTTSNGTNYLNVTSPGGKTFYRLESP